MGAQRTAGTPEAEVRCYLMRGAWFQRVASVCLFAGGTGQVVVQLIGGHDDALVVVGVLQALLGLVQGYLYWARTPQIRISGTGIDVREGLGSLRHYDWAAIDHLQPEGPRAPASVLHLIGGGTVRLPGVHRDRAHHLAALVARRTGR